MPYQRFSSSDSHRQPGVTRYEEHRPRTALRTPRHAYQAPRTETRSYDYYNPEAAPSHRPSRLPPTRDIRPPVSSRFSDYSDIYDQYETPYPDDVQRRDEEVERRYLAESNARTYAALPRYTDALPYYRPRELIGENQDAEYLQARSGQVPVTARPLRREGPFRVERSYSTTVREPPRSTRPSRQASARSAQSNAATFNSERPEERTYDAERFEGMARRGPGLEDVRGQVPDLVGGQRRRPSQRRNGGGFWSALGLSRR